MNYDDRLEGFIHCLKTLSNEMAMEDDNGAPFVMNAIANLKRAYSAERWAQIHAEDLARLERLRAA